MTKAAATHADHTDDVLDLRFGCQRVAGMMVRDGVQAAVLVGVAMQKAIDPVWRTGSDEGAQV